jgi:hypothetical protein
MTSIEDLFKKALDYIKNLPPECIFKNYLADNKG